MELHTRNEQAISAVREAGCPAPLHDEHRRPRRYLMVAGAQAIATSLGYTTGIESIRRVPATDDLPGYWEATATVMLSGQHVGRGVSAVFDDERLWNSRPHFARQGMAQTRATGRALKGVMGWACAMIGAETSLAEEMPQEGATVPQDGTDHAHSGPSDPHRGRYGRTAAPAGVLRFEGVVERIYENEKDLEDCPRERRAARGLERPCRPRHDASRRAVLVLLQALEEPKYPAPSITDFGEAGLKDGEEIPVLKDIAKLLERPFRDPKAMDRGR